MALSPAEQDLLGRFRAALHARFGDRLERLVLFGSRARGEGHEHSDLDVLVLVDGLTREERVAIFDMALDLELDTRLAIGPIARDPRAWSDATVLAHEIRRDGIAL